MFEEKIVVLSLYGFYILNLDQYAKRALDFFMILFSLCFTTLERAQGLFYYLWMKGGYNSRLARILIGQRTAQTFLSGIFTIYMMVHSPNVIQEIIDTL